MDNLTSAYLVAPILGWLSAHTIKFVIARVTAQKQQGVGIFFQPGGMPSSHSAVMVAILTVIGIHEGIDSAIFGLGFAVSAIIIYDAINVRRSVGEQGTALKRLLEKSPFSKDLPPYQALGHRPIEVIAGALLGLVIGLLVAILIT